MTLEIVRRVRGNVHGTIDISALEDEVLAQRCVQRLRRIKQTAFLNYVFPGASHSRFEHSLGVMHLASIAWEKLKANQQRLYDFFLKQPNQFDLEKSPGAPSVQGLLGPTFKMMQEFFHSDEVLQALRLASLLHDVGHPPFSHSGERFLPGLEKILAENPTMSPFLREHLEEKLSSGKETPSRPASHEIFSLLIIDRVFQDLEKKAQRPQVKVTARDIISIIKPEIEPESGSPIAKFGLHRLLNELISGEIDIDRMDYLLRDSKECGVVYGVFDAGRILDGLSIYFDDTNGSYHLAINFSSLAAFEDYLRARQSMYQQVYFHKTAAACEGMMQQLADDLGGWNLPAALDTYLRIDEYSIENELRRAADSRKLSEGEHRRFIDTLEALLLDRNLWKMVYEVNDKNDASLQSRFEIAEGVVRQSKCQYQKVSSKNFVTRFQPRQKGERSKNYLRLIKKDELQIPRVVPIEDYSEVIKHNPTYPFVVTRIYVEKKVSEAVKARIVDTLKQQR